VSFSSPQRLGFHFQKSHHVSPGEASSFTLGASAPSGFFVGTFGAKANLFSLVLD
jgi:hypothetical protein